MKRAVIISTGDELVSGKVTDTNGSFISSQLTSLGIRVNRLAVLPDERKVLSESIVALKEEGDILIITGGLGPTQDDITVEAVSDAFALQITRDGKSEEKIKSRFSQMGREVNETDLKMATVPESAVILENPAGLAPGFMLSIEKKTLFVLPGVPDEMKACFTASVLPYLHGPVDEVSRETVFRFFGLKESEVDNFLSNIQERMPFDYGITVEMGTVTAALRNIPLVKIKEIKKLLQKEFDKSMLSDENVSAVDELVKLLKENELSLTTAESCTGGLIGEMITDIPGASEIYYGSVTAYSNEVKTEILKVPENILQSHGAVSLETAAAMAENTAVLMRSDISLSTTGIAGPGGGSPEKPVGTVCFGFRLGQKIETVRKFFPGDRKSVRIRAALFAIDYVRRFLRTL